MMSKQKKNITHFLLDFYNFQSQRAMKLNLPCPGTFAMASSTPGLDLFFSW